MSMHEAYERAIYPTGEGATSPRFSFANSSSARTIGLEDYIIGSGKGQTRIIQYENIDSNKIPLRDALDKLTLGDRIVREYSGATAYKVPTASRPLEYESSVTVGGLLGYEDEQLAHDLGSLFGKLAMLTIGDHNVRCVIKKDRIPEIGQLIAIVDFTPPNEDSLFYRPGVENDIVRVPSSENILEYYASIPDSTFRGDGHLRVMFEMGLNELLEES